MWEFRFGYSLWIQNRCTHKEAYNWRTPHWSNWGFLQHQIFDLTETTPELYGFYYISSPISTSITVNNSGVGVIHRTCPESVLLKCTRSGYGPVAHYAPSDIHVYVNNKWHYQLCCEPVSEPQLKIITD